MAALEKVKPMAVAEANARLPLLRRIVGDLVEMWRRREQVRVRLAFFQKEIAGGGSAELAETVAGLRDEENALAQEMTLLEHEVQQLGGMVKDPAEGIIDFLAELEGHLVHLTWMPGDSCISHWREIDGGLEERKPLPVPAQHPGATPGWIGA